MERVLYYNYNGTKFIVKKVTIIKRIIMVMLVVATGINEKIRKSHESTKIHINISK